jgi:hypothetical protein
VLTLRVALTDPHFATTKTVAEIVRTGMERVTAIPGVIHTAATRTLPLESDWRTSIRVVGRPADASPLMASYRIVSPGYFDVLNIPVLRGRALTDRGQNRSAARCDHQSGDGTPILAGRGPTQRPAHCLPRGWFRTTSRFARSWESSPMSATGCLSIVFGACALLLAAVGMCGVMAYAVQQRTYEIGVRLALGAGFRQVRNIVLLDGLKLATWSVVPGCVTAAALTGTLRAYLFEVRTHDALTFIMAPVLLGIVAFMAVWIPARRASRVDPVQVLRGL